MPLTSVTEVPDRAPAPPVGRLPLAEPERDARSPLVLALAHALRGAGIRHCLWKGFEKPDRIASGAGDLDLLIDRPQAASFAAVLGTLGMREAMTAPDLHVDGVTHWLGFDAAAGRLIHVHAHFRVVIGRAYERHYDLGCAAQVLDRTVPGALFFEPNAAMAWILFVLRQSLNHRAADVKSGATWLREIQPACARLSAGAPRTEVLRVLGDVLPDVRHRVFDRCASALDLRCAPRERLRARQALEHELAAGLMRPSMAALARRAAGAVASLARRRPAWAHPRLRPQSGGAIVALIGTDGAGKSTCAATLTDWLGAEMETRHIHLGRPPRSLATMASGGVLKGAQLLHRLAPRLFNRSALSHCELLRALATGRDRYLLYRRARRWALNGTIVIAERYPLADDRAHVGPSGTQGIGLEAHGLLAWLLRKAEWRYYAHIARPDRIFALVVRPETAVRRKTTEPSDYVRERAERHRAVAFARSDIIVVDAERPAREVAADVMTRLWGSL